MKFQWIKSINQIVVEYSENSTIHGVNYLNERKLHLSEKIFWIIAIVLSFLGCSFMIYTIYEKWSDNPVIVTFAEKAMPVSEIPFPAVTICPVTKLNSEFFNFTHIYHQFKGYESDLLTPQQIKNFAAATQICNWVELDDEIKNKIKIKSKFETSEIVQVIDDMSISMNETFIYCARGSKMNEDCSELFTKIITEEGFCYTFNLLDLSELLKQENLTDDFKYFNNNVSSTNWTLQDGYKTKNRTTYPRRVLGSGERGGLELLLGMNKTNFDYICGEPMQGFKIILHTPGEVPQVRNKYFRVSSNQATTVNIIPNMITTSPRLRGYTPEHRQCFFDGEKDLQFFKVYTQSNCEMECLANYTLNKCGCVKFSMPRYSKTKVCGIEDLKCYENAQDDLFEDINENLESGDEDKISDKCNCMPACTSINYQIETSQVEYEWEHFLSSYEPIEETEYSKKKQVLSYIVIYFKEAQFINSRRDELYGWRDFVANCGGLLGLFMGVSMISIVEIIYYLTFKLLFNLKQNNKNNQPKIVRPFHIDVSHVFD